MSTDIKLELTEQRFAQLLASYGAEPERWPAAERAAALAYLDDNARARRLLRETLEFDQWLQSPASYPPAFPDLETRVLQRVMPAVARSVIDRLLAWLLPSPDLPLYQWWRPAVVACLPLVMGLVVGFQIELAPEPYTTTFEEELYLISLSDYAEIL